MTPRRKALLVTGVVLAVVALGFALLSLGAYDVSATARPSWIERRVAPWVVDRSVARRAPRESNPIAVTPEVLAAGLSEYRENCLMCHGTPGGSQSEIAQGLNPSPPDLADPDTQESSDGELFQVISAGIRMTGMPAFSRSHSREQLWTLVAFVRRLPKLTDAERRALTTR